MTGTGTFAPPTAPHRDDLYARALRTGRGPLFLRHADGSRRRLPIERWCAAPDAPDESMLTRCRGGVVDLGCGPGRLTIALSRRRVPALGVDSCPQAVERTRAGGGTATCRSVFEPLPREGAWETVLLADGNLGIGGDPDRLLRRCRRIAAPHGRLIVEVDPLEVEERGPVRMEDSRGLTSGPFLWGRYGLRAATRLAARAGLTVRDSWSVHGRRFAVLTR